MLSKDKTYKVLKIINKRHLTSDEINAICKNSYIHIQMLISKHLIRYSVETEDQGPQEPFKIDSKGLDYLISKEKETKEFWKSFFTNFICGFLVGVSTAIVGIYLTRILG